MKSRILIYAMVLMAYQITWILKMTHHPDISQIQRAWDTASAMSTAMANSRVWIR